MDFGMKFVADLDVTISVSDIVWIEGKLENILDLGLEKK